MGIPRWKIIKRHKFCVICLTSADHERQGQRCPHKSPLSCKCGSEKGHHKLLCSYSSSHTVSNTEQPTKMTTSEVALKRKSLGKKSQSLLPNPHCLRSHTITVITLSRQKEASTRRFSWTDYFYSSTLFLLCPKKLLIPFLGQNVKNI